MTRNKEPDNGLISLKSNYSVRETATRLETVLKERGLRLFARIDHTRAAAEAGLKMRPTEVLLFYNPAVGTPMMLAAPTLAIDLPFKGLVWEDSADQVWLTYNTPEYLLDRHDVPKSLAGELNGLVELLRNVVK
jgi:uncharacterized protein (DUF302 family)